MSFSVIASTRSRRQVSPIIQATEDLVRKQYKIPAQGGNDKRGPIATEYSAYRRQARNDKDEKYY